jgi:hypothetical protein
LDLKPGSFLDVKEDGHGIHLLPVQEKPIMVLKKGVLVLSGAAQGDIEEAIRLHCQLRLRKETSKISQ